MGVLTYQCSGCGERKPQSGFHLRGGRQVQICPECWSKVEPYQDIPDESIQRAEERAWLALLKTINRQESLAGAGAAT